MPLVEMKDPSGGTTGRVKPYGRLGWMGARAEYSLDGEGKPLPHLLVAAGPPDVQTAGSFFNFLGRILQSAFNRSGERFASGKRAKSRA